MLFGRKIFCKVYFSSYLGKTCFLPVAPTFGRIGSNIQDIKNPSMLVYIDISILFQLNMAYIPCPSPESYKSCVMLFAYAILSLLTHLFTDFIIILHIRCFFYMLHIRCVCAKLSYHNTTDNMSII